MMSPGGPTSTSVHDRHRKPDRDGEGDTKIPGFHDTVTEYAGEKCLRTLVVRV